MRSALFTILLSGSLAVWAQDAPKPAAPEAPKPAAAAAVITADELMEKHIAAIGGREALKKVTSLDAVGTMEIVAMGGTATTEMLKKAPDKYLNVTNVDGYGEVKEGYDGTAGWSSEPQNGLVDVGGARLAAMKRQAQFQGELKWKELYAKGEVMGKEQVNGRDAWKLVLTPAEGKPEVQFYDAETFLLLKHISTAESDQGVAEIPAEMSDYKDIGNGVKMPYTIKITMPGIGDLIVRYKEYKVNVDIDDAKFSKPKG
jgi:hypothetical protein